MTLMTLPAWSFARPFGSLFDDEFELFPLSTASAPGARAYTALNVWSDETAYFVEAELPGISFDALELSVLGSELTIAGDRPEVVEEGVTYHRRERGAGAFKRVLQLPSDIDAERVSATLEGGVLTIELPKAEAVRPRRIAVKAGQ